MELLRGLWVGRLCCLGVGRAWRGADAVARPLRHLKAQCLVLDFLKFRGLGV